MASARTFDLKIVLKMSPEIVFTSINKEEHELVEEFLKSKKLRVKNEMNDDMAAVAALDSDSDEEMQSVASDGEDAPKPRPATGNDEDSEEGAYSSVTTGSFNMLSFYSDIWSGCRRRLPGFILG
jgi:structure-specific recognition protein 1